MLFFMRRSLVPLLAGILLTACGSSSRAVDATSAAPDYLSAAAHSSTSVSITVVHSAAPGEVAACPTNSPVPSMDTGQYCGPTPAPGNGSGPDGECTGKDFAPPCAPGAVAAGLYYAYTVPGHCDGRIFFDGRSWQSELPPPAEVSPFPVWIRLTAEGRLAFISPGGAVAFDPVPSDASTSPRCRG